MNNIKTCHGCGIKFKPNFGAQRYCTQSCWHTSAEKRAIHREVMLDRWHNNPEFRAFMSEVSREHWRNPGFRALMSEMSREQWRKHRVPKLEALKIARSLISHRK